MSTGIEWTDETWNPIVGCTVTSPGCTNCYAMRQAARLLDGNPRTSHYAGTTKKVNGNAVWTGKVAMAPDKVLLEPYHAKWPKRYFVNSMGDLFHPNVPAQWIDRAYAVMALSPTMTFQILTKHPEMMQAYWHDVPERWREIAKQVRTVQEFNAPDVSSFTKPLANVWLGVSVENQAMADERIPLLLNTPAARRFISAEPLLGPVNIGQWFNLLDWVIVGGESGKGARPMHPDWARALRDQCAEAGIPYFMKQWGEWAPVAPIDDVGEEYAAAILKADESRCEIVDTGGGILPDGYLKPVPGSWMMERVGKKAAGCLLDGVEHKAMP